VSIPEEHPMKKLALSLALSFALGGSAFAADAAVDIWKAKCKGCHGEDGKAKTKVGEKEKIDDLSDPKWQANHSDEKIREVITNGSKKEKSKMKPFKDKLSAEEIDSLVQYIRTLKAS
jgi:mono/diheme cytochrome c family protein